MASAIDPTVPAFDSDILSVEVRDNFGAAALEITALQNSVAVLQTKTSFSGDATVAANGTVTITGISQPLNQLLTVTPTTGPGAIGANGEITVHGPNGTYNYESEQAAPPGDVRSVWSLWASGVGDDSYTIISNGSSSGIMGPAPDYGRLRIQNNGIHVYGGVVVGFNPAPTTPPPNMGPGTINAEGGIFINGVPVGTSGGSVSMVTAGTGLATTPAAGISTTGSIALATIGSGGGPYTNATISIDAYGRVTAAASGTAGPSGGLPDTGGSLANPSGATLLTLDNAGGILIPTTQFRSSGGTLPTGQTATTGSVNLGLIRFTGHDGTPGSAGYRDGATITAQSASGVTWNPGNAPTQLIFSTTRTGSGNAQQAMRIDASGGLVVGNPTGNNLGPGTINAQNLHTSGTLYIQGQTLEDYIKAVVGI